MKEKDKNIGIVNYEVEFKIKVKGIFTIDNRKSFQDECFHPSTIAQWVLEDLEEDLEEKEYEILSFDKITFTKGKGCKKQEE